MTEHTPIPWRTILVNDTAIVAPDGTPVAQVEGDYNDPEVQPVMEANAALIVRAVNSHADMLSALETLLHALGLNRSDEELVVDYGTLGLDAIRRARAAIRRAKGEG